MAARHQLNVEQGATFRLPVFWYEPLVVDGKVVRDENGVPRKDPNKPIDLTGCTARMQIRPSVSDPNILLSLTTENGGITLGGTSGQVVVLITDEQTATLASGVYDLEIEHLDGQVTRLFQGKVRVSGEVTR